MENLKASTLLRSIRNPRSQGKPLPWKLKRQVYIKNHSWGRFNSWNLYGPVNNNWLIEAECGLKIKNSWWPAVRGAPILSWVLPLRNSSSYGKDRRKLYSCFRQPYIKIGSGHYPSKIPDSREIITFIRVLADQGEGQFIWTTSYPLTFLIYLRKNRSLRNTFENQSSDPGPQKT